MDLSASDLDALVCTDAANDCMQQLYENINRYQTPLRMVHTLPAPIGHKKYLGLMPSRMTDAKKLDTLYFGTKCLSVFLGDGAPAKTHQGAYLLFDGKDGKLLCTIDAAALTALRTAASSAVAARALVSVIGDRHAPQAMHLGIIGTGEQAYRHAIAIRAVFAGSNTPITQITLWGRKPERAQACLRALSASGELGVTYAVASHVQDLVGVADILCTLTSSTTPVVTSQDLQVHSTKRPMIILAVGACTAGSRELSHGVVTRAQRPFVVDTLEGALCEAGDLLAPDVQRTLKHDATSVKDCILTLSTVLSCGYPYDASQPANSIIYKSVGFGAQDLALAIEAFQSMRQK